MVLAPSVGLGAEGVRPFDKARFGAALYAAAKRAIDVAVAAIRLVRIYAAPSCRSIASTVRTRIPRSHRSEACVT